MGFEFVVYRAYSSARSCRDHQKHGRVAVIPRFSAHVVRDDMKHLSFDGVRGDGDKPLIRDEFKGKTKRLPPDGILSMVLT